MRIASLWRLRDDEVELKPELGRSDDPELRERIRGFLDGGSAFLFSPGLREDRLDPSQPPRVPLGYCSDGEWIWPLELTYYLEHHGVLPQKEFLAHMEECGYEAPEPTPEQLAEAAKLLGGG